VGVIGFPAIVRSTSLNSKLQVACIGIGGMGGRTMESVASHPEVQITALCDVDSNFLTAASRKHPHASTHRDWRELLAEHSDKFDAVTIGTPDHMHAAPAVTALRAKKHLYLQKPMAPTLHECRVITRKAAQAGVVTQLGNQGRSSIESRHTVELIRSGVIGKIKEVILWENKKLRWWPKNTDSSGRGDAVPATLDWDLWLGVQAPRPYFADTYHPQTWRAWYGFGVGEMGDMGCHHFDISFDALKLTAPLRVQQLSPITTGPLWGKQRQVELVFPGSDITGGDTVKLTWHDGEMRPDASLISLPSLIDTLPESGACWIGNLTVRKPPLPQFIAREGANERSKFGGHSIFWSKKVVCPRLVRAGWSAMSRYIPLKQGDLQMQRPHHRCLCQCSIRECEQPIPRSIEMR